MKRVIFSLRLVLWAVVFSFSTADAQVPQTMSYQAVVRNSSNNLVINTQIGMQISILSRSATGVAVYAERQTVFTNENGLVSMAIGAGTPIIGTFSAIDWS